MADKPGMTYIENNGSFFDLTKADDYDPQTDGTILYATRNNNFILFTPEQDNGNVPAQYNEINTVKGVTFISTNMTPPDVPAWAWQEVKNSER